MPPRKAPSTGRLAFKGAGHQGRSWYVDETSIKVHGRWSYLYRAIDRNGKLIDSLLSETRDLKAAQRFFRGTRAVEGHAPGRVTMVGYDAYSRAIRSTLGPKIVHCDTSYVNNRLEPAHQAMDRAPI